MKVVVQLVRRASVSIDGQIVSSIGKGYLLLVGLTPGDDIRIVQKMADKIVKLRVFPDENGKTNLSLSQVGGSILPVSQFTLYGSVKALYGPFKQAVQCFSKLPAFTYFAHSHINLGSSKLCLIVIIL